VRLTLWLGTGDVVEQCCPRRDLACTTKRLMTLGRYARTSGDGKTTESLTRVDRIEWMDT
jgi:hypothetical protein